MPRALLFLQWLGICSAVRRLLRSLRTVKGIVSVAFWVLACGMCLFGWLISLFVGQEPLSPTASVTLTLDQLERHGSLILLALSLFTAVKTTGKGAIVGFSPPEVVFLVAGPFSRRHLLTFKFLQVLIAFFLVALGPTFGLLFLGSFFKVPPGPWPARYVGVLCALVFLKLLADNLTSLALIVGTRAYNLWRKVALWSVLALVVCAVLYVGSSGPAVGWQESLNRLEDLPVISAILQVPRVFLRAALCERYWPDFFLWGGASLAIDALLFGVVIKLDAIDLETAASVGERMHARLARIRAGESINILSQTEAKPRASLPDLPSWGGIGPLAWRQLQSVLRSRVPVLFVLAPLGAYVLGNVLLKQTQGSKELNGMLRMLPLAMLILFQSLFLPAIFSYDFRRDYDRMEALKTLPIGSARLVLGQVLTPVLCTSIMQVLAVVAMMFAGVDTLEAALVLGAAAFLAAPISLLTVLSDNIVFLISPSRPIATPGAQFSGLRMLLNVGKFLLFYLACGIAGVIGAAVYFLAGQQLWLAVIVAWVVLAVFAVCLVPLAALLFRRFDVARERPA